MLVELPLARLAAFFGWCLLSFSSLMWPPPIPTTIYYAKDASPWLLATIGMVAAAISAVFDWHFVRRTFQLRKLAEIRKMRLFGTAERYAKVAPFVTIVAFGAIPSPFVIVRVLMPLSGYPIARYVLATSIGRFFHVLLGALVGQAFDVPAWVLLSIVGGAVVLSGLGALWRWYRQRGAPPLSEPPAAGK